MRLEALERARGLPATPANIARVADGTTDEAARWAFAQWDLRSRARAKFARAEQMLFVREALEQATHERVAEYHASRFPPGALVADLTAGIGSDLMALARRGPAVGFELEPERSEAARWNSGQDVRVEDSLSVPWEWEYAIADPARRVYGRRTLNPDDFAPNPVEVAARMASLRLGGIKLTPLLHDPFLESLGPGLEFVSFGGECREALVWCGREAEAGWWAVHVESGERLEASDAAPTLVKPEAFLFEADPAAIRAHCLGTLCHRHGLSAVGDSKGYLTGTAHVESVWLRAYRVLYTGKSDLKTTRQALRELEADTPELKQRGAGLDLQKLRREFPSYGTRKVSVAIWPNGRSLQHTIVEVRD